MNWKINSLEITNFKFFKQPFKLNLEGKNLLMYGENGSGKSSIYWAFYTIFQSCYKKPTPEDAQKYFISSHPQNLRNKFSKKEDHSSLIIELISDSNIKRTYEDSDSICNTHVDGDTLMTLTAGSSDFLNYKFLSILLDFKNSEANDIFSIIESDILPSMVCSTRFSAKYVTTGEQKTLVYWWHYINNHPNSLPRNPRSTQSFKQGCQEYKEFQNLIEDFNIEFDFQLKTLQEETVKKLKKIFNIPVEIRLKASKVIFNKKREGTIKGYDGIVHRPKVIISALMTNKALPNGPEVILHPSSFFNEAKLTCIALAFRLAAVEMRYKGENAASALFIDDLLISLDMGRRLQVIDIILELRKKHQLIIFTHDRAFYDIISTKIESLPKEADNWVQKEIYAQDEILCIDGIPSHFILDKEDYLVRATNYLYSCDLPACANYLRKATEHELKRLYPSNWLIVTKQQQEHGEAISHKQRNDLSGLISKLSLYYERYKLPPRQSNLDIHRRRLLNPLSHDDLHTPIYRIELQDCINEIRWLQEINRIKDVSTEEEIRNNRYCIEYSHKGRYIKVIIHFTEVFDHIMIADKTFHSNSIMEVLYCSHPKLLNDKDTNHTINELLELLLQYLGYHDGEELPEFDELVKPYTKEHQIADIVQSLYSKSQPKS